MNFDSLQDKVAVVTGGSGIIGYAICEALLSAGVKTSIISLHAETAGRAAKNLNDKYSTPCIGIQADVLNKQSLGEAKKIVNEKLGSIDFLVNCAGGNSPKATTQIEQINAYNADSLQESFFGLDMQGFNDVFALNFTGTLLPVMVFAEDMLKKQSGAILNISSVSSLRPLTKVPAYSAAKASINNFTQWLAVHFAKTGVRVNAIAPGFFLTEQNRFLLADEKTGQPTPRGKKIIANTPMGKYGEPEHLQGAVLFLLSDLAEFVTGVVLPVDGGYSAYGGI